jgi:hypothetical protein
MMGTGRVSSVARSATRGRRRTDCGQLDRASDDADDGPDAVRGQERAVGRRSDVTDPEAGLDLVHARHEGRCSGGRHLR